VFRSFHTIKGLAGFLDLGPMQQVSHEIETILDHARERRIAITPHLIDLALKAADYLRAGLDAIATMPPQAAMRSLNPNGNLLKEIASMSVSAADVGEVPVPGEIAQPDTPASAVEDVRTAS